MKYSEIYTGVDTIDYTKSHLYSRIVTKTTPTNRSLARRETMSIAKCKILYNNVLLLLFKLTVSRKSSIKTDISRGQTKPKTQKMAGDKGITSQHFRGWGSILEIFN